MSKAKYFLVQHKQTGAEHLVRAGKPADAIAAVAGDRSSAVQADPDAIADFYADGGQVHPNSAEAGSGKLFFVPNGDGRALVRAKNAGEAFGKVNGSDLYDTTLLNQDQLVAALDRGLKPIRFEPKLKRAPQAAGEAPAGANAEGSAVAGDGAGDAADTGASDTAADAPDAYAVVAESTADAANEEAPADAAA